MSKIKKFVEAAKADENIDYRYAITEIRRRKPSWTTDRVLNFMNFLYWRYSPFWIDQREQMRNDPSYPYQSAGQKWER